MVGEAILFFIFALTGLALARVVGWALWIGLKLFFGFIIFVVIFLTVVAAITPQ